MKKLKKIFDATIIAIVAFVLSFGMFTSSIYATELENKTVNREFEFSGLKSTKAIQNFDYGSKNEVFITQREGKNTYLSRCIISNDGKAYLKDYIILKDYGHGESIEVIKENGKTYIWIGNTVNEKPNPNGTVYYWSKDISRIEYVVDSSYSTGAKVGDIKTITNIENASSSPAGKAFRTAVAIADGSDRICFRTQIDNSSRSTYYGVYKLSEINKVLNSTSQSKINMSTFKSSQVSYFKDLKSPNGSFQGFDITGVGSNNKFLYIYGGAEGQTPTIYKYLYTNGGNYTHVKTIQIKGSYVGKLEAEGIKVETNLNTNKDNIFVSFKPPIGEDGKLRPFRLYSFEEGSQPTISVTSVKLNKTSTTIVKGNTEKLTATISPSDATNKDVIWSSSNTKVATVDASGNVKAIASGSTTITVTTKDGSKKATCSVTVPASAVSVTSVKLNKTSTTIEKGKIEKLTATVSPSNATNKAVTWTSSNTNVATVDASGNVKAIATGSATITVTTKDGSKKATCNVTVPYKFKTMPFKVDIGYSFKEKYKVEILDEKNNILYTSADKVGSSNYNFTYKLNTESSSYTRKVRIKTVSGNKTYTSSEFKINKSTIDKEVNLIFRDGKIKVIQKKIYKLEDSKRGIYTIGTDRMSFDQIESKFKNKSSDEKKDKSYIYTSDTEEQSKTYILAHKNTQKVYDYFVDKFGIEGIGRKDIYLFPNSSDSNAKFTVYNKKGAMLFGHKNGKSYAQQIDIVAHEYIHGILVGQYGLLPEGESRSIHEGLADYFACLVDGDWEMGEGLGSAERNIANPGSIYENYTGADGKKYKVYPNHYSKRAKNNEGNYAYINSSIVSHLAYLTSQEIGKLETGKLILRSLSTEKSKSSIIGLADSLYKNAYSSEKDAVAKALKKIGLYKYVTSVKLNKTSTTLTQGRSEKLTATINPSDAMNKAVVWTSSNTKIATVDSSGNIKAIAPGSATITATAKDGSNKKATCSVKVTAPYKSRTIGLKVNIPSSFKEKHYVEILDENNKVIYTSVVKTGSSNYNFTYQLDKSSSSYTRKIRIRTVSGNKSYTSSSFKIDKNTIEKDIIGTFSNGKISVVQQISVKSVQLNKTTATVNSGSAITLKANINPINAANKNVTWSSSNTKIATVSSTGVVTGISPGTATITVTTKDGSKKATCKVTVNPYKRRTIGLKVKVPFTFKEKHYVEILDGNNKVLYKSGIRTGSSNLNFTYTLEKSSTSYKRKVRIRTVSGKLYTSNLFTIDKNTINKDITATYKSGKVSITQK